MLKKKITGTEGNFFYYLFWKIERKKLRLEVWFRNKVKSWLNS